MVVAKMVVAKMVVAKGRLVGTGSWSAGAIAPLRLLTRLDG
jgi:hypothetical protein